MKPALTFALIAICSQFQMAMPQTIEAASVENGQPCRLTFTPVKEAYETFSSVTVTCGFKHALFAPRNPLIRVPSHEQSRLEQGIWTDIPGISLDRSGYFFTGRYSADAQTHSLLFFLGNDQIGTQPLLVVGFGDDGTPYKVLEQPELDMISFEPENGRALIIGQPTLSQVMDGDGYNGSKKPYATTYDPSAVYVVQPGTKATYSLAESRRWNRQHYVWAGPHMREDYAVLHNVPGHPKLFGAPSSRLDSILGRYRDKAKQQ